MLEPFGASHRPLNQFCSTSGDADGDERLSLPELWAVLKAHFAGKHESGSRSPIPTPRNGALAAAPDSPMTKSGRLTEEDVARLFGEIDVGGTGAITWQQFRAHLARQALPERLII